MNSAKAGAQARRREPLSLMEWDALMNRVVYQGDTKAQRQLEVDKAITMDRLAEAERRLQEEKGK